MNLIYFQKYNGDDAQHLKSNVGFLYNSVASMLYLTNAAYLHIIPGHILIQNNYLFNLSVPYINMYMYIRQYSCIFVLLLTKIYLGGPLTSLNTMKW